MKTVVLLVLFGLIGGSSFGLGFLIHPLTKIMKIQHRAKYDRGKCITRPQKMYGHFISDMVYPGEIHTFYVNQTHPNSDVGLGRNLKPVTLRVMRIDWARPEELRPWKVFHLEACIPNEEILRPSYE